jgi:guanylate kinase
MTILPGAVRPQRGPAHLFIVSAPSGAGKSTLRAALLEAFPDMRYSVSHTTRRPRPGEVDGRDYHFISPQEFREGIEAGRWAEWAEVHGNYYGTSAESLARALAEGVDLLLEIDVQGARQIVERFPESVTIFILPPSLEALRARMAARGTESPEELAVRMRNAEAEMAQQHLYRHRIVNDDLEAARREMVALIAAYRQGAA